MFEQALEFARKGGTIDITSSIDEPVAPAEGIARAVQAGIPLARVTLSSDGNGSQPFFNDADLLVMTPELRIEQVYARGKLMVKDGKACVKGTFETA